MKQQFYYIFSLLIKCALELTYNERLIIRLRLFQQEIDAISTLNLQNIFIIQHLNKFTYLLEAYGDKKIKDLMSEAILHFKHPYTITEIVDIYNDIHSTPLQLFDQIRAASFKGV